MEFIRNLEQKMIEKNLNRSQLARGMGVAPSTVNSWFNRSAENITLKTLKKLAEFLDCSIDSLVYGDEKEYNFEEFFMRALTNYLEEKRK
jgi:transcriptional regulator with XRE-family HTH domain